MRTRLVLASAVMGAALLTGGTVATAQATPASSGTSTTTAAPPTANQWIYVGTYRSLSACQADGRNSVYSEWDCKRGSSGKYQLWVNDES
ncbi:hypothetical protein AB0C96_31985 [Streptomyces sp. NPDC048506]|uniref:hypothetical protein n=1 Tax=Streptomyces sp. NPDC048506 TaxID=3155028 RepID=UPI00343E9BED